MAWPKTIPLPSHQPEERVLGIVFRLQQIALGFTIALSAITLSGWVIPPLGRILPTYFVLMRANNAFLIMCSAVAIAFSLSRRSRRAVQASRLLALFVVLFACLIAASNFGWIGLGINTLFAADPRNLVPGRVSGEAAFTYILLGLILTALRARKHLISHLVDLLTLCLCLTMLTFLARYVFRISHLFTINPQNPFSAQTFLLLGILTFLVTTRRAEYGLFSILLGSGIGGKIARIAAPCAIILPFLFAVSKDELVRHNLVTDSSGTAAATSLLAIIAFCLVLALSVRTNDLERAVRDLSLRDELTRLYNRRGFYVLAEQALRLARRSRKTFFVLFIDVDDLKRTNDSFGHDAGSSLLREVAVLIDQTFRETDVVGRIGGDEFVVAGRSSAESVDIAVQRLEEATTAANQAPGRPYKVSISLGCVFSDPGESETLDQLLERADHIMYQAKRRKKQLDSQPPERPVPSRVAPATDLPEQNIHNRTTTPLVG